MSSSKSTQKIENRKRKKLVEEEDNELSTTAIIREPPKKKIKIKREIEYTKCNRNDAKQIYNIIKNEWPKDLSSVQNYERQLENKLVEGIMGKDDENEIVGLILWTEITINRVCGWKSKYFNTNNFKFIDGKKDGNKKPFYHITHLVVKKKYRNKGIGAKLLSLLLTKLKGTQEIKHRFGLRCSHDNETAIKIYKNAGFVQGGYTQNGYGNGKSAIYFTLII